MGGTVGYGRGDEGQKDLQSDEKPYGAANRTNPGERIPMYPFRTSRRPGGRPSLSASPRGFVLRGRLGARGSEPSASLTHLRR